MRQVEGGSAAELKEEGERISELHGHRLTHAQHARHKLSASHALHTLAALAPCHRYSQRTLAYVVGRLHTLQSAAGHSGPQQKMTIEDWIHVYLSRNELGVARRVHREGNGKWLLVGVQPDGVCVDLTSFLADLLDENEAPLEPLYQLELEPDGLRLVVERPVVDTVEQ
jgi:hypothetical protein